MKIEQKCKVLFVSPEVYPFAKTGGLADTVKEFNPATGQGDGFLFEEYSSF